MKKQLLKIFQYPYRKLDIYLLVIPLFVFSIGGYLAKYWWGFELISHFKVQYLLCSLCVFVFCIWEKLWKFVLVLAIIICINFLEIIPAYFPYEKTESSEKVKILFINLKYNNTSYEKASDYIQKINPDILGFLEFTDEWNNNLQNTLKYFPFQKYQTRSDGFGIGLFSKINITESQLLYFDKKQDLPSILMKINDKNKAASLILTHPLPPTSQSSSLSRNTHLQNISHYIESLEDNIIVMGDLNTSPWSHFFKKFLSESQLKDSRKGFGVQPSWPTTIPLLWIPIDHFLYKGEVDIIKRSTGEYVGSDHFPVYVEAIL